VYAASMLLTVVVRPERSVNPCEMGDQT